MSPAVSLRTLLGIPFQSILRLIRVPHTTELLGAPGVPELILKPVRYLPAHHLPYKIPLLHLKTRMIIGFPFRHFLVTLIP